MNRVREFLRAIYCVIFMNLGARNLEILALRQQLANYKTRKTKPKITGFDRAFWILLRKRMIGTLRREILDHVIIFWGDHLRKILNGYFDYYHNDRSHMGLGKDSPNKREITPCPSKMARVVGIDRVGGLYQKYEWLSAS